jgi:hypothetical protein
MTTVSKRAAMKLVADIRHANVSGHAFASRSGDGHVYYFLGGLEAVLRHFLEEQGCAQAAAALKQAMNDEPTQAEITARNEELARLLGKPAGSPA